MSYVQYTVTQLADELGVNAQTLRDRISRQALPDKVTVVRVGRAHVIYVPKGMKIIRVLNGKPIAPGSRPGRNAEWVLTNSN